MSFYGFLFGRETDIDNGVSIADNDLIQYYVDWHDETKDEMQRKVAEELVKSAHRVIHILVVYSRFMPAGIYYFLNENALNAVKAELVNAVSRFKVVVNPDNVTGPIPNIGTFTSFMFHDKTYLHEPYGLPSVDDIKLMLNPDQKTAVIDDIKKRIREQAQISESFRSLTRVIKGKQDE